MCKPNYNDVEKGLKCSQYTLFYEYMHTLNNSPNPAFLYKNRIFNTNANQLSDHFIQHLYSLTLCYPCENPELFLY